MGSTREKDPTEFGVVSIGAIHGGTAANIIPDDVVLAGTIRSFEPEVRAKMLAGIERTAKAVAAMSNAPEPEIKIIEGAKAVINDCSLQLCGGPLSSMPRIAAELFPRGQFLATVVAADHN